MRYLFLILTLWGTAYPAADTLASTRADLLKRIDDLEIAKDKEFRSLYQCKDRGDCTNIMLVLYGNIQRHLDPLAGGSCSLIDTMNPEIVLGSSCFAIAECHSNMRTGWHLPEATLNYTLARDHYRRFLASGTRSVALQKYISERISEAEQRLAAIAIHGK